MPRELWVGIAGQAKEGTLRFIGWVHEMAPDGIPLCRAGTNQGRHVTRKLTEDPVNCTRCEAILKNPLKLAIRRRT